jgi:CMP-N,N'-diacetyllegionaminic acid synthase
MTTFRNVCLIPAKAASTRLKKKNILTIKGKELIYYPIHAARESKLFGEDVFVSTESEEIREIALRYGAKSPYLREERLAHDPFGVADVALDFFEKIPLYKNHDNICILLSTFPMILKEDIERSFEIFMEGNHKCLMSVSETDHNALRSVFVKEKTIRPLFSDKIFKKSQELEKTYRVNGAVAVIDIKEFLESKSYYIFPVAAYVMPRERSIDIDTEFDYRLAKLLMEHQDYFASGS